MNQTTAQFCGVVTEDDERFDIWKHVGTGQLYVSEFAEDNLRKLPEEMYDAVHDQLGTPVEPVVVRQ